MCCSIITGSMVSMGLDLRVDLIFVLKFGKDFGFPTEIHANGIGHTGIADIPFCTGRKYRNIFSVRSEKV